MSGIKEEHEILCERVAVVISDSVTQVIMIIKDPFLQSFSVQYGQVSWLRILITKQQQQ